ncbi:MAG: hypothetical protein U0326_04550 [Polyangiales bacterium]
MRSRPALKVYIAPSPAKPGDTLQVSAVLKSASETPVDAVTFSLQCEERVTIPEGRGGASFTKEHLSLVARHDATVLTPGEHRYNASFALPTTAPPSYESDRSRIAYVLEARVDIPWWPDRVGRYVIDVAQGPIAGVGARPGLFATSREGPHGKSLYAECSLDSTLLEPGGVVRGSVSFSNVRTSTVERVTAALVLSEAQHASGYRHDWVQGRYEFVLHEGEVFEGEAIPFGLSLPRSLPVTMRTAMIEVGWSLEIGVEGGWSSSTLLAIPVMMLPVGSLPPVEQRPQPPSVGRARRRQLWGPAATRAGLAYDPDADVIRGESGDVRLSIAVEQRVRDGLFTTATLRWPSLGMALSLGPSRWNDRFTEREIDVGDQTFDDRYRIRGRFAEQVRALLDAAVRASVPPNGELRIDDEGATVSVSGALSEPAAVEAFARDAARLARELARSIAALPSPAPTAPFCDAWRSFAARAQARWSPGDCAVVGARYGVDRFDLGCVFSDDGRLVETFAVMHLDPPLGAEPAPATAAESRALIAAHRADVEVVATASTVRCALGAAPADGAAIDALLDVMARAGRKLQGRSEAAPYR